MYFPVQIRPEAAARLGVPEVLSLAERPGGSGQDAPWIDYRQDRAVLHLADGTSIEMAAEDILMVRD
jgi:hypothetical protein